MASIFIAHGKATGDSLLDLYADRQFRGLFKCQKLIWKKLSTILTGEFPEPKMRKPCSNRLEESLKERILELREQGQTITKITELTGASWTTVHRLIKTVAKDDKQLPIGEA